MQTASSIYNHRPMFTRLLDRPLLVPRDGIDWEAGGVLAPAVIKTSRGYLMIYRAFGSDKVSRLGRATSDDGVTWELAHEPLLTPANASEQWGLEDPRMVSLEGMQALTYTAASGHNEPDGWHWTTRVQIATSRDGRHFQRLNPILPAIANKDAVLFPRKINGRYWLMHRFMPDIWVSQSTDLVSWREHRRILEPVAHTWQASRIGAGAPPIETPLGWLVFHHGVAADLSYSMSAFILDLNDPTIVRYRLPYPVLVPERSYETVGYVPNVCFGTAVTDEGDTYRLYYGGADFVIAAAKINKAALLSALADFPAESAPPRALPPIETEPARSRISLHQSL